MKLKIIILLLCSCICISGCGDQLYLERSDIILMLGIDFDENNQLTFYASTPVFNTEVKKNYRTLKVKAKSLREARYLFDAFTQGSIVKGKIQTILIGKKFLQKKPILPYLDVILRDPKDDLNSKIVMVNGSVEDVFHAKMEDKGRLGVVIRNILDSTVKSGTIISPSLQQFNAVQLDKRGSPSIPEITVINKEVKITGLALLSHKGLYVSTLDLHVSPFALILQDFLTQQIPISLHISSNKIKAEKEYRQLSLGIKNVRRKVNTNYVNGQFQFDIHISIFADLVERMFFLDSAKHHNLLTSLIEKEINHQLETLLQKTQKEKVDPFGFGVIARAKQYKNWKKIENNWYQEYAKAKIRVTTNVQLINTGVSH